MTDVSKKPKLPEWLDWVARDQDPRPPRLRSEVSEYYAELSRPPTGQTTISICCWTDLLGFGQTLASSQWQPSESAWKALHERITEAHWCCYQSLNLAMETVITLNDGVVRCYDSDHIKNLTLLSMWLRDCVITHNWINNREAYKGLPGARTVLSSGEQLRFSHSELRLRDFIHEKGKRKLDDLFDRLVLSNQLQLNLAFSRAYLLDQAGSKYGVEGAHFYLDQAVIDFLRKEASSTESQLVETTEDGWKLFAIRMQDRRDYFHLGFLFDSHPISVTTQNISTTVWRVLGFCPWDEPQPFGFVVM